MDEVIKFLKERGVDEKILAEMEREKVDPAVIMAMSDDQLEYYLPAYGDRIAVKSFLRVHGHGGINVAEDANNTPVLNRLRQKIAERRRKSQVLGNESESRAMLLRGNSNAVRENRRIEIGWHDFQPTLQTHKQVRVQNGGGIRHLTVPKSMMATDILQTALQLFFPDGKNKKGDIGDFEFEIRNVDGSSVGQCTMGELYERTKVKMLRLVILSRRKTYAPSTVSTDRSPEHGSHVTKRLVLDHNNCRSTTSANDDCQLDDSDSDSALPDMLQPTNIPAVAPCPIAQTTDGSSQHMSTFVDLGTPTVQLRSTRFAHANYANYVEIMDSDDDDDGEELQSAIAASFQPHNSATAIHKPDVVHDSKATMKSFMEGYVANLEPCTLVIQRRRILSSVFRAVKQPDFNFHRPVTVVFSGEDATDEGGPKREFFRLLMVAVCSEMGIFEGHPNRRIFSHNIDLLQRQQYRLAGQLVTWSLVNGGPGLNCLSKHVCGLMMGLHMTDDLLGAVNDVDVELKDIISQFLAVKTTEDMLSAKEQHMDFLLANGICNIHCLDVTDSENVAYKLLQNILHFRVSSEITQFTSGLGELWTLMKDNPHLMTDLMTASSSHKLTPQALKKLYCITFSDVGSRKRRDEEDTVYFFEMYLQECEEKHGVTIGQVCSFWTGADSEPPAGFQSPSIRDENQQDDKPLSVGFYEEQGRLPYASTCGLRLWLPTGVTETEFNTLISRAVTECCGFGKV